MAGVFRILAYHRITDEERTPLCVSPRDFARQLGLLRRWRFGLVTLAELEGARSSGQNGLFAALTFDDGFADNALSAHPLMEEAGARGTFFVSSALLAGGPGPAPSPAELLRPSPYMTWEQAAELLAAGCEIGSHGRTHRELPGLDDDDLAHEVAGSRADLEEGLGSGVESFAYPRGAHDERVEAAVAEAGYLRAVVTPRDPGHVAGQFSLERVGVYRHTGLGEFAVKLSGAYSAAKRRGIGRRAVEARRRMPGRRRRA